MSPLRPVKEIFADALELTGAERDAFLERECAGDEELRARVARLLEARSEGEGFLTSPTAEHLRPDSPPRESPGARIGPYKLLQQIGEGGFGVVFMAEQTEPIVRRVALKIIKLGMDTRQVIARFEAERQALALMDHPGIARVLDAGATDTGRPYFVMELIAGEPITSYCDRNHVSTAERLLLFLQVCHAVQHAHQKGIIHRDIKPSNVLVTVLDGRPVPKVIDFGIAKATSGRLTEKTLFTEHRQLIGTPEYMSPEQAEMSGIDIDTRTDIYSLGVLLYELLTGTTPFDAKTLRSAAFDEIRRIIREVEPEKPSTRLSALMDTLPEVAAHRATEPARLRTLLRGDLDWIVMKCLEKPRSRRYETVNGLAMDVQRHLAGEPVHAAPSSRMYRVTKFVRRNRMGVGAAVGIAGMLALGLAGTTTGMVRAVTAEGRAEGAALRALGERDKAEKIAEFMEEMLSGVGPSVALGRDTAVLKEIMETAAKRIRDGQLASAPESEIRLRLTVGGLYRDIGELQAAHDMLAHAERMARSVLGPDHPVLARALDSYGSVLAAQGDVAGALPRHEEALSIRSRLTPGGSAPMAICLGRVAYCLQRLDRLDEAVAMFDEARLMARRVSGEDSWDAATATNNLATCLEEMSRHEEAISLFQDALAAKRCLHTGDHPGIATTLHNVAFCLRASGRAQEALPYFEEALAMKRRLYEHDHPELAASLGQMAQCFRDLRRESDALLLCEEALGMLRRLHAADHPNTAVALFTRAGCLDALGRTREALPDAQEALDMWDRLKEGDNRDKAACLNLLGKCLSTSGRAAEALGHFQRALAMWRSLRGEEDDEVTRSLNNIGFALRHLGRSEEALPYFQDSLAMARRLHTSPHGDIGRSLNNVGFCYMGLDRPDEAIAYFEEARAIWTEIHPEGDMNTAVALNNIAMALQSLGRPTEALPKFEAALAMVRRIFSDRDHPAVATCISNVADCLLNQNIELERAETMAREALAMDVRLFGPAHPDAATHTRKLADVLRARGTLDESERLARESLAMYRAHPEWGDDGVDWTVESLLATLDAAGRWGEAAAVHRELVGEARAALAPDDPALAGALAQLGLALLRVGTADAGVEAEAVLRECLSIRERAFPEGHESQWLRFNTMSLLGASLVAQAADAALAPEARIEKLRAAEHLLLDAHALLSADPGVPPPKQTGGVDRRREALERIVTLYEV